MKTIKTLTYLCCAVLIGLGIIGAHGQTTFQITFSANATGGGSPSIVTGKSSVKQTTDDGYIFAGTTTLGVGSTDIILIKTTAEGDTMWVKTYGGVADNEYGYDVEQTTDGWVHSGWQKLEFRAGVV